MDDGDQRQRLLKAVLLAGLVGAAIISLMRWVVFPALVRGLTHAQVAWLRQALDTHTVWVLLAILAIGALLGVPVLLVALWAARLGPWRKKPGLRGNTGRS
jgi:sugar phosphate permease